MSRSTTPWCSATAVVVFGDGGGDPVGHGADYLVGHIYLCGLPAVGSLLGPAVQEWLDAGTFPEAGLLTEAVQEWDNLTSIRTDLGDLWPTTAPMLVDAPKTYDVLADPDACQLLEICLGTLQPSDWAARSLLARAVWRVISRCAGRLRAALDRSISEVATLGLVPD